MAKAGQSDAERLDDLAFMIRGYRIDTDEKEKAMRLVFFGEHGQRRVLGHLSFDSPEAYEFAAHVLKNYDRLEGIK